MRVNEKKEIRKMLMTGVSIEKITKSMGRSSVAAMENEIMKSSLAHLLSKKLVSEFMRVEDRSK